MESTHIEDYSIMYLFCIMLLCVSYEVKWNRNYLGET